MELEGGAVSVFLLLPPKARSEMLTKGWLALQESQKKTVVGLRQQKAELQRRQRADEGKARKGRARELLKTLGRGAALAAIVPVVYTKAEQKG